MRKSQTAGIIISFLFLSVSLARAQYYPPPPPPAYAPPPGYIPPPPGYYAAPPPPPPDSSPYFYFPPGAGPYFRAGIGPSFFQDGTLKGDSISGVFTGPANQRVSYDTGVAFSAAGGYAFDKYFGVDFETGYIWAQFNNIQNYQVNDSSIANVPLLVNGTLSLPIPHTDIVPYIGGGVGGSVSELDAHHLDTSPASGFYAEGTESDVVFAYQAFAGLRFMLGSHVSLGVGYKYFATGNPTFDYPPSPDLDISFKGVRTHSVLFTLQCVF
ncbi:MAG TPA: outer membrane beta-barrel protein [Candidatus Acidoferrum sp.]|nr:outer membrane beta-barrel protein [Candidatus Acidoferrum sp.]